MRNLILCGLTFLLLALHSNAAAPLQLSGDMGRNILEEVSESAINNTINNTINNSINNTINNTVNVSSNLTASSDESRGGLWSWGKIPVGHSVNQSGKLIADPITSDPTVEVPAKSSL